MYLLAYEKKSKHTHQLAPIFWEASVQLLCFILFFLHSAFNSSKRKLNELENAPENRWPRPSTVLGCALT